MNNTILELSDILPSYLEYVALKREYQLGNISESRVIKSLKFVCIEIEEFLNTLYNCTDMNKERKCIIDMINHISTDFSDK